MESPANELREIIITVSLDGRQWLQHISVYIAPRSLTSNKTSVRDEQRPIDFLLTIDLARRKFLFFFLQIAFVILDIVVKS